MANSAQGYVVFLRAANVGGNDVFRPAQLALALPHLDIVNVGAAGTFVVRGKASEARIRREILEQLPFAEPTLPLSRPAGRAWSVRFDRVESGFALGSWQRRPGGFVFASEVVEASLGVPVTTRWWETLEKVAAIIEK